MKREGIELTANFTAPVNAELRVGAIAETVIVSGQTPVVNVRGSQGGVRVNMIPREGGNAFKGSLFYSQTGKRFQSDNFTAALKARGLRSVDSVDHIHDVNVSEGGPIMRNKLWFESCRPDNVHESR